MCKSVQNDLFQSYVYNYLELTNSKHKGKKFNIKFNERESFEHEMCANGYVNKFEIITKHEKPISTRSDYPIFRMV